MFHQDTPLRREQESPCFQSVYQSVWATARLICCPYVSRKVLSIAELKEFSQLSQQTIETPADWASLLEMICSESDAFRPGKGRIAPYFQGHTQRAARIKSRIRPALATEELR